MSESGDLRDTYAAAIQHDLVDLTGAERLVGVVRRPLPWFHGVVDENRRNLGPPDPLLEAFKERSETLLDRGMAEAEAHNQAIEDIGYPERYETYLQNSTAAQEAMESIRDRLKDGTSVVLVCYENTEEKRCHRTILKAFLQDTIESGDR